MTRRLALIKQELCNELPGVDVQRLMSPISRDLYKYYKPSPQARKAAVMAVIYIVDGSFQITYIRRTSHPKDRHSGQISFPGGGLDKCDTSLEACAIRETYEETGLHPEKIEILGELSELYVYASDNLVTPFLGYYPEVPQFVKQPSEVAEIINVPLTHFDNPSVVSKKDLQVNDYKLTNVPFYDLEGHVLWGATAMITAELLHIWRKTEELI